MPQILFGASCKGRQKKLECFISSRDLRVVGLAVDIKKPIGPEVVFLCALLRLLFVAERSYIRFPNPSNYMMTTPSISKAQEEEFTTTRDASVEKLGQLADANETTYTVEEEKTVLRKIDLTILPMVRNNWRWKRTY